MEKRTGQESPFEVMGNGGFAFFFLWFQPFMDERGMDWQAWSDWAYEHRDGLVFIKEEDRLTWDSVKLKLAAWLTEQGYDAAGTIAELERWEPPPLEPVASLEGDTDFDPFEE